MSARRTRRRITDDLLEECITPVHRYWLVHDQAELESAARAMSAWLGQIADSTAGETEQVVRFTGWMSARGGYALSARALRRGNPGYRISVKRSIRPDAPRGRREHGSRLGFLIEARGLSALPPFVLAGVGPGGLPVPLPPSNHEAEFQLSYLGRAVEGGSATQSEFLGYVDSVEIFAARPSDTVFNAITQLIHLYPQEIFVLIDSGYMGAAEARALAANLRTFTANARWADRVTLAAEGEYGEFSSDLTFVDIRRHPPTSPRVDQLPMPELIRTGAVVRFEKGQRSILRPDDRWFHLDDAAVQDGGTVIADGALVLYEASADPSLDFVSGQWESVYGSRKHREVALVQLRDVADVTIDEAILLSGRNDFNWFHWLIEYLPRLTMLDDVIGSDVPVMISSRTPSAGIEALRSITARKILIVDASLRQPVRKLHVLAPQVQVLDTTMIPWNEGLSFNTDALMKLKHALGTSTSGLGGRRFFLQRKSAHRGLLTEGALATVAARRGLEIVDPGRMDWAEQVACFSSAELIVGASGAVMADYLLMKPGSRILALTSDTLDDFVLPGVIAAAAGAQFSYLTGPPASELSEHRTRGNWIHESFSINPQVFEDELVTILAELDS